MHLAFGVAQGRRRSQAASGIFLRQKYPPFPLFFFLRFAHKLIAQSRTSYSELNSLIQSFIDLLIPDYIKA